MKKYLLPASIPLIICCIAVITTTVFPAIAESNQTTSSLAQNEIFEPPAEIKQGSPLPDNFEAVPEPVINPAPATVELSDQWGLDYLSIDKLWNITQGSRDVLVAILDTGIDASHPDLVGQVAGEVNFSDSPTADDIYGHGTHIAGIIAASLESPGTAGIAPKTRLLNVKVAEDNGTSSAKNVARGIIWAVDNGASIINISIQISDTSPELKRAVEYANDRDVIVVAAAGNNRFGKNVYPACYPSTIAVTALTHESRLAPLANITEWVDLVAPGYKIYSTMPEGSYGYQTGTSFATAYVSGYLALLHSMAAGTESSESTHQQVLALLDLGSQNLIFHGHPVKTINPELLLN